MQAIKPVLVVDDSEEDAAALERAFKRCSVLHPVLRCQDGDEALDYLNGKMPNADWPDCLPAIMLLDLNMPGTDGRTVLDAVKRDPRLHDIPVIIFSSSANERDVADCYRLGANSYLTKPIEFKSLEEKVRATVNFWLETSELPRLP